MHGFHIRLFVELMCSLVIVEFGRKKIRSNWGHSGLCEIGCKRLEVDLPCRNKV